MKKTKIIRVNLKLADLERGYAQAKAVEEHVRSSPYRCPITQEAISESEWWGYLLAARRRVEWFARELRQLHLFPVPQRRSFLDRARRWVASFIMPPLAEA